MSTDKGMTEKTVTEMLISTSRASRVLGRMNGALKHGRKANYCMALLVVGPPRVGKTHLVKAFAGPSGGPEAASRMVVEVGPSCTLPRFMTQLLEDLGDPKPSHGDDSARTLRIHDRIKRAGKTCLVIDEAQRLIDEKRGTPKREVVNWVVSFLNAKICPVIIVGTPPLLAAFEGRDEMEGRTLGQVDLLPYDWAVEDDRNEFRGVLALLEEELQMEARSDLADPALAFRIWSFSRGRLGFVARLLDAAHAIAIDMGRPRLTLEILAEAADELRIGEARKLPNPFRAGPVAVSTDVIAIEPGSHGATTRRRSRTGSEA